MSAQQTPPEATMAQQLQTFTRNMMAQVIEGHATRTDHDGHCCTLAAEYAARLGRETTTVTAQTAPEPFSSKVSAPRKSPWQKRLITGPMARYVRSLSKKVSPNLLSPDHRVWLAKVLNGDDVSFDNGKELLEALISLADQTPRAPKSFAQPDVYIPEEGTYKVEDDIYQVVTSRYDHRYAKLLNPETGRFEYVGQDPFDMLTPDRAVTTEDMLKHTVGASSRWPDEGFYFAEGTYYKVQDPKVNGGGRYAKRWNTDSETWVFDGQKHFKILTPESKLTAEQASSFGALYGKCIARGCDLTNEVSIHWGYGEKCAANNGWPYHTNY